MIEEIRKKIEGRQFKLSKHAVEQALIRKIQLREIEEAISNGQIIESYPGDKYGPSCLICGFTKAKRPVHVQCSHPSVPVIKIITVYEPDLQRWSDNFTKRIIK